MVTSKNFSSWINSRPKIFLKLADTLNTSPEGRNWEALAIELQYYQDEIKKFGIERRTKRAQTLLENWMTTHDATLDRLKEALIKINNETALSILQNTD